MKRNLLWTCAAALTATLSSACSSPMTNPSPSAAPVAAAEAVTTASKAGTGNTRAGALATAFEIKPTFTVTGNAYVGNVVTLNLTLTNISGVDDPYGGFGWILLSNQVKRTQTPTTANPKVLCEAYRGHQGGLTQAVYDDFCRVWVTGPIAAGQSITLAFPVKLLSEGTYSVVGEMTWGVPDAQGYYPNVVRMPLDIPVGPAPPKVGGGGGGTTSGAPDLQATAKVSTGAVAPGGDVSWLFNVRNSGKVTANNISFSAPLPAGFTVAYMLDGQSNTCTVSDTRVVSCAIAYLVPGQTGGVMIGLTAPATLGSFSMTGTFGAPTEGDSNLSNNSATASVTIK